MGEDASSWSPGEGEPGAVETSEPTIPCAAGVSGLASPGIVELGEGFAGLPRAALIGDAPLPPGVDEELLERSLIKLREFERQGALQYDRNTESWKEFRRRQRKKRGRRK